MNKKIILIVAAILLIICGYFILNFLINNYKNANRIENSYGVSVSKQELQSEINKLNNFYKFSNQKNVNQDLVKKNAFDRLIEDKLVERYASQRNIIVSENEAKEKYDQLLKTKSEEILLNQLQQMYGMDKNDYLLVLKKDILREKVQKAVGKPLAQWLSEELKKADIKK